MPQITVENETSFVVEAGKKLVLGLEDNGIDILHRCGGHARCTTCRVQILAGEVPPLSDAERTALDDPENPDLVGDYRLSCQLRAEHDLTLRVAKRAHLEGIGAGPRPQP